MPHQSPFPEKDVNTGRFSGPHAVPETLGISHYAATLQTLSLASADENEFDAQRFLEELADASH